MQTYERYIKDLKNMKIFHTFFAVLLFLGSSMSQIAHAQAVGLEAGVDDTTTPTVTITAPSLAWLHFAYGDPVDVTIVFSEVVSNFVQTDVTVSESNSAEATVTSLTTDDNTTYTATITPTQSGTVDVSVAADVAVDGANNPNTASNTETLTFDLDPPSATLTPIIPTKILTGSGTKSVYYSKVEEGATLPAIFRVMVSPTERLSNMLTGNRNITITGGTMENHRKGTYLVGDNNYYSLVFEVTVAEDSTEVVITIPARFLVDTAGNRNTEAVTATYSSFDLEPPTIQSITGVPSEPQPGPGPGFEVRFTYSEPISLLRDSFAYGTEFSVYSRSVTPPAIIENETDLVVKFARETQAYVEKGWFRLRTINDCMVRDAAGNMNAKHSLSESEFPKIVLVPAYDFDGDGDVDIHDVLTVMNALDQSGEDIENSRTDVDGSGTVDIEDLKVVIETAASAATSPTLYTNLFSQLSLETVETLDPTQLRETLDALRVGNKSGLAYQRTITFLEHLLAATRPEKTQLLANYPNPFNPETWIPYELSEPNEVRIRIYDVRGRLVKDLQLGHQPAGYYTSRSRAAYWDGRNDIGERVASGIYFYQLQADNTSLLRKMVILK